MSSIRTMTQAFLPLLVSLLVVSCKNSQKFNSEITPQAKKTEQAPASGTETVEPVKKVKDKPKNSDPYIDDNPDEDRPIITAPEDDTIQDDTAIQDTNPVPDFNPDSLDPKGHNPENNCQICLQKADYLAQQFGFRANINRSMNYGPDPASREGYPGLCDIHFQSPNGQTEFYFFCRCDCGWPNRSY